MTTFKLYVMNFAGACMISWAVWLGYVQQIFSGDVSHISSAIVVLFLLGVASVFYLARDLGKLQTQHVEATSSYDLRKIRQATARLQIRQAHMWDLVEWLVLLSLIGNAVGFYISAQGIDPSALASTEGIVANAGKMLSGVGVAISGTIVGGIACFWTWLNVRTLDTATSLFAEEVNR